MTGPMLLLFASFVLGCIITEIRWIGRMRRLRKEDSLSDTARSQGNEYATLAVAAAVETHDKGTGEDLQLSLRGLQQRLTEEAQRAWRPGAHSTFSVRRAISEDKVRQEQTLHVHTEDMDLYVMGVLVPHQSSAIESHLTGCIACIQTLADSVAVVQQVSRLMHRSPQHEFGSERRRYHRISTEDSALLWLLAPFSPATLEVQIMDVSKNGLSVRGPKMLVCGSFVQVHLRNEIIAGEVRHCSQRGGAFYTGIQLLDATLIHKVCGIRHAVETHTRRSGEDIQQSLRDLQQGLAGEAPLDPAVWANRSGSTGQEKVR